MKEIFDYVLEFMLTFDKKQNTDPLICIKFEIWGQSILEVFQAFHTVCIVLYIGCSGPVVECLNKINMKQSTTQPLPARTPNIQNYAYSMKILNNFQNAPASDFELFFTLNDYYLAFFAIKGSINSRT